MRANMLVQGQNVVFLVSDPLGLGWNLFGTRGFVPNIAIICRFSPNRWCVTQGADAAGGSYSPACETNFGFR